MTRMVSLVIGAALLAAAALAQAALPIENWTTSGGTKVYFVRAPSIPMLDLNIDFDAGSRFDPEDKAGLSAITNGMLARGVTGMNESAIDEGFAVLGAMRRGGASDDRASMSLRTLTSEPELSAAVALLAKILATPTFPAEVLARERERISQSLRESESKPEVIVQRTFSTLLYGKHPYGLDATAASIAAITRDEVVDFYRNRYGARRAVLSMIGDVTRSQAEAIAEQLMRNLPPGGNAPAVSPVVVPAAAVERRIAHPAQQSHILIGLPAIARGDPDFFPLFVGNYVLGGGGFASRLYSEVREKRGLAYSVYSYFSPQLQPGPFTIGLQTQKEQTDVALGVVREVLARFLAEGPTATELTAAKANLVGGFPLRIDSNRKILDNLANIGFFGLPLDYLDTWPGRVEQVTAAQIKAAFARYVLPDRMATVVVGAGDAAPK